MFDKLSLVVYLISLYAVYGMYSRM